MNHYVVRRATVQAMHYRSDSGHPSLLLGLLTQKKRNDVAVDAAEVIGWVEGLLICLAERGVDCTLSAISTSLETRPNSLRLFKFIFTV